MKLHEFINTTLTEHNGLFKTKVFQDGLHRYQDRYRQNRQDVETWKADPQEKPMPAPLLLGNTHTDPKNAVAMMAAMLAVLHDEYIRDDVPLLGDWPGDVRDFLQNNVLPRFRKYGTSDIGDEWGLVLSKMVRRAVVALKTPRPTQKRKPKTKTKQAVWKEAQNRTIARELSLNSELTADALAKKLECHPSTIVRSAAWLNKSVLHSVVRDGIATTKGDDTTEIDGIYYDEE